MSDVVIELREPDREPRQVIIGGPTDVGRACDGINVADEKASRRHLTLTPRDDGVEVVDLQSSNGTFVSGTRVTSPVLAGPGDVVRLGDTELMVVTPTRPTVVVDTPDPQDAHASAATPEPAVAPPPPAPSAPPVPSPPARARAALEDLEALSSDAAVIRYRDGTAGAKAAKGVAAAARKARRKLAGFGSEPWGVPPQICLVDPYRAGDGVVTGGTVVDAERNEVWMVVTSESPPEPLERPLARLFGAGYPAGAELAVLFEGYGLHLADSADPDSVLATTELPPLSQADGELASAMSLSFVRFLVKREGTEAFLAMLAAAQPNRLDEAVTARYGSSMAALEQLWREGLAPAGGAVRPRTFLRTAREFIRPHVARQIEIFVYMLASLAFTMAFPFVTRQLIDTAIPSGEMSEVLGVLALLGVALVITLISGVRQSYVSAYVSAAVVRRIRRQMFERLQYLSAGWFYRHQQGDVLSRFFSDVAQVEAGLSQVLRDGLFQLLTIVVSAVILVSLNWQLSIVVFLGAPAVFVVYKTMAGGALKRSVAVSEQTGTLIGVAGENYAAQPVVSAFGLERREIARFDAASDRLFTSTLRLQLFSGMFGLSVNMIVTVLRLVVLGLGAWLILEGQLTIGGLVAFLGIMGEVIRPVTSLAEIGQQLQAAMGSLQRVNEVMDEEPQIADAPNAIEIGRIEREIRLSGVSFQYTPERQALDGVDCVIPAASRVAFVGPSGAGKSSILQLLMRFYDVDEGSVAFDGHDVRTISLSSLRDQLGVVFQESFLFDSSIRDNIRMGRRDATDEDIEAAASAAELHEFVTTLPNGYDTTVGERGGMLSGGQRQRLAIARALIRNPSVLVLDEATSALDPRTESLVAETLMRVGQGRTTIAVTHRINSVVDYDRIFVVAEGRIIEQGSHEELVEVGGMYARLWAEQSGAVAPTEAPFDAAGALGTIALFEGLAPADLTAVAQRLRSSELDAGESVPEGGGQLVIVRSGIGQVLVPGLEGDDEPTSELRSGDAFGLTALLGGSHRARLRATETMTLLVLDDLAITAIAAAHPSVAAVLAGQEAAVGPAGGQRLSRVTIGRPRPTGVVGAPIGAIPDRDVDARRATGTFSAQ